MASKIAQTRAALDRRGVTYEFVEHPAVMTVDEFRLDAAYGKGLILKNLFLRDDTGTKTFMYSCPSEKRADLKQLAVVLGVKKLTFGSPEWLFRCTGLTPGAVSPLGLIFDYGRDVVMVFNEELLGTTERIGVHPGENTATVFMEFDALTQFLREVGASVIFIKA
ncbi:MAG: prolyl-tRNA synthetase associated domain-containing protein [Defluviitaleaceae bacterium]|nr:prolyl-tRNA synthetase associated domain-containing protein [Defluviitaleaceae bacterium]